MTGVRRRAAILASIMAVAASSAFAGDAGVVQAVNHPGFGRLVFEFAGPTPYNLVVDGDRVIVVFEGAPVITSPGVLPRNVRGVQGGQGAATLLLGPGARARAAVIGNGVVIDVLDPPRGPRGPAGRTMPFRPAPAAAPAAPPNAAPAVPVEQEALSNAAPAAPVKTASGPKAEPAPAPKLPAPKVEAVPEALGANPGRKPAAPGADAGPAVAAAAVDAAAQPASPQAPAASKPEPSMLASVVVLAEPGTGAAALRRGDSVLIVFDGPAEVDEARLRRLPGFADATVQQGPAATTLRVTLAAGSVALTREVPGWRIVPSPLPRGAGEVQAAGAVVPEQAGADVVFKLAQPGRVVAVADPATGGGLLVGTVNPADGPADGLPAGANVPGAAILPTWAGVAVEPFSDDLVLRAVLGGFVLSASSAAAVAPAPPTALTRRFDFPDQPVPALMQRLRAATAAGAAAAPRARTPGRVAAAQAMLALGLGAEAQSVLSLVAADDPTPPPDVAALSAIAGLLAGRVTAAQGLDAAALDGSDEIALWRGVRDAMLGRTEAAARVLPGLMPLALAYPAPLRDRVLPIVAETAVLADDPSAASLPDLPHLGFARALQMERRGQEFQALAAYDALAAGQDQLDQVRAGVAAVELRLASGRMDAAQAAAAMSRLVATWRGDAREAATRMRAAELYGKAGNWRTALDLLRETEALFPDAKAAIRARMAGVFNGFLAGADVVAPLDVITLVAEYADCIPPGADLAGLLTDKLLDLDLPARARVVLEPRVAAAPPGPVRSGLGYRLAALQLEAGEAEAAGRTLTMTELAGLPERLAGERLMLGARVKAARGDPSGAATLLATAGTAAVDELRARVLEQAGDWRGVLAALDSLSGRVLPANGPVPDDQADLVLRQASAAVQLGDAGVLRALNGRYAARLSGARADLFRLLTASPVGGISDLPRAGREIALARAASGPIR